MAGRGLLMGRDGKGTTQKEEYRLDKENWRKK